MQVTFIPATFECNFKDCKKRKDKEQNGWFELHIVTGDSILICAFSGNEEAEHYCSEAHTVQAISQKLPSLHRPKENENVKAQDTSMHKPDRRLTVLTRSSEETPGKE